MFGRRKREERQQREFALSSPSFPGDISLATAATSAILSAAETGIGLLDRSVSNGRIDAGRYTSLITDRLLGAACRSLVLYGTAAIYFDIDAGNPRLLNVRHNFLAKRAGRQLLYLTIPYPNGDEYVVAGEEDVAICHWSTDATRPWEGRSPLDNVVSEMGARTGQVINRESLSAHGYLLPWSAKQAELTPEYLKGKKTAIESITGAQDPVPGPPITPSRYGRTIAITDSNEGFLGTSENKRGATTRFGFDPPAELKSIVDFAEKCTLSALGVPSNLFSETLEPGRDSWRRYIATTAAPIANKISRELSRILEVPVTIDLSTVRTSDEIVSRARAAMSLSNAGVETDDALRIAGLTEDNL